ncbi:hypothetical protein Syncc8109_1809 [Synechococcus sp. WH 8109]|nr:hypothetical protein Syncc8109_1809 [Synechococcus sp. WH 8109]
MVHRGQREPEPLRPELGAVLQMHEQRYQRLMTAADPRVAMAKLTM